jgi:hypothetical protein
VDGVVGIDAVENDVAAVALERGADGVDGLEDAGFSVVGLGVGGHLLSATGSDRMLPVQRSYSPTPSPAGRNPPVRGAGQPAGRTRCTSAPRARS